MLRLQSRLFIRARPPPSSIFTNASSAGASSSVVQEVEEPDEMLALGLRPLLSHDGNATTSKFDTQQQNHQQQPIDNNNSKKGRTFEETMTRLMKHLESVKKQKQQQQQEQQATQQTRSNDVASKPDNNNVAAVPAALVDPILSQFSNRASRIQHLLPEMQRLQRNRGLFLRKWTKQDVAEVIRRTAPGTPMMMMTTAPNNNKNSSFVSDKQRARDRVRDLVVSETDPLERKTREDIAFQFYSAVDHKLKEQQQQQQAEVDDEAENDDADDETRRTTTMTADAAIEVIAEMSDAELSAVIKSGAIDIESLWEGDAEFASLPREFLEMDRGLTLARELADLASPHNPTDDEAQIVTNAEKGDVDQFLFKTATATIDLNSKFSRQNSERDLQRLEEFERRQAYSYTETPNVVLRELARSDDKIRESLEVMDRAKRSMLRDADFQAALAHVRRLEHQEVEQDTSARPVMRKGAAELAVPFFDQSHSRPPLRAAGALPEPTPRDRQNDPLRIARRRERKMRGRLFSAKDLEDQQNEAAAGARNQGNSSVAGLFS